MSNSRRIKRSILRARARWNRPQSDKGGTSNLRPLHGPRSATPRRITFVWPPTAGEDRAKLLTPEQKRIREEERQLRPMYLKAMRRLWPEMDDRVLREFRVDMPSMVKIKDATLAYPDPLTF